MVAQIVRSWSTNISEMSTFFSFFSVVTVYDCPRLGGVDCSLCVAQKTLPPEGEKFNCHWCDRSKQCTRDASCSVDATACPAPTLESVSWLWMRASVCVSKHAFVYLCVCVFVCICVRVCYLVRLSFTLTSTYNLSRMCQDGLVVYPGNTIDSPVPTGLAVQWSNKWRYRVEHHWQEPRYQCLTDQCADRRQSVSSQGL